MNAWSTVPVCAPARTAIITGVYPSSTGSEHMRSNVRMPAGWKMLPGYLREAGYYCTNNVKEDYNLEKPPGTWDESSNGAHWRKRAAGQPFFSVFNFTITHESQIRTRPHTWVHDPARVRVPAYHPDTPEVRQDWAQYYDNITTMDGQAGRLLDDLEKDGLAGETIVFFFGDHGSGMPRSKRWLYNSGLNVSIVVSIPEKFRHLAPRDYRAGTRNDRLVGTSRLDSLCGRGGNDELWGRDGPDRLLGDSGRDSLSGGPGRDSLYARDNARDVLICGPGRDVVRADRRDEVAPDCELVRR